MSNCSTDSPRGKAVQNVSVFTRQARAHSTRRPVLGPLAVRAEAKQRKINCIYSPKRVIIRNSSCVILRGGMGGPEEEWEGWR